MILKVDFEFTLIQLLFFILKYLHLKDAPIVLFNDLKPFTILFIVEVIHLIIVHNFFTFINSKFQIITNC